MRTIKLGVVIGILLALLVGTWEMTVAQGPQVGADGLGDPYFPQAGNGGYDALHYTLELDVDVATNWLAGVVTMRAKALENLRTFNLDFAGFEISSVQLNGRSVLYKRTDHELIIRPPLGLTEGEEFEVRIAYEGEPGATVTEAIPIRIGWTNYGEGVYVASEPIGSPYWYPVNDHPLDKATYSFRITLDDPLVAAANGLLQETISNGDGTTTYVWKSMYPIASYLVTVAIDDFEMVTETGPEGLPIRNFFPKDVTDMARVDFGGTADMIAFFSEVFGPYPFEAYGVVVADTRLGFALETQTLSLFSRDSISGQALDEETVAHELAHQWFGNSVSLAEWPDIWLNDALATYASWLWCEHSEGEEALRGVIYQVYDYVAHQGSTVGLLPPGNPPRSDLFNYGVYLRGGLTLHALRERVGDEIFFKIMRVYYDRFAYGNATTEDFIAVAEEVSGQELGAFFDAWLYDELVPDIPSMGLSARSK